MDSRKSEALLYTAQDVNTWLRKIILALEEEMICFMLSFY